MKAASCALVALVVLAAAGCGGGGSKGSDQQQVTTAVTDFAHAFGKGDGKTACSLLTPAARNAFVSRISTLVGTRDCAQAIGKLPSVAGPNVTGPFQTAKVDSVKVNGNSASARLTAAGHSAPVTLQKQDGNWLLAHVPGTSR